METGIERNWNTQRFGEVRSTGGREKNSFEIAVFHGGVEPDSVSVELFAEGVNGGPPERHEISRLRKTETGNGFVYGTEIPATRSMRDYTARIIPRNPLVRIPLEAPYILWQR